MSRWLALGAALLLAAGIAPLAPGQIAAAGPSFDCAHVTAQVTRLICATPALAALDAKLAADFSATLHQGGIDAKALQADEDRWLTTVRNRCADVGCLQAAYSARDAAILDQNLQAASPAAYAETRPFPASAAAVASARAMIGRPCGVSNTLPGSAKIGGYLPVITNGAHVEPLDFKGSRFAFLMVDGPAACTVADVVTLPDARSGAAFLQCTLGDDGDHGFGVRRPGQPDAYWTIDAQNRRLTRQPLGVLAGEKLICRQPETGE
jgi:uncharacterized protein